MAHFFRHIPRFKWDLRQWHHVVSRETLILDEFFRLAIHRNKRLCSLFEPRFFQWWGSISESFELTRFFFKKVIKLFDLRSGTFLLITWTSVIRIEFLNLRNWMDLRRAVAINRRNTHWFVIDSLLDVTEMWAKWTFLFSLEFLKLLKLLINALILRHFLQHFVVHNRLDCFSSFVRRFKTSLVEIGRDSITEFPYLLVFLSFSSKNAGLCDIFL